MKLNINERIIDNPDEVTIRQELLALGIDEYAILIKEEFSYIQTLVDPDGIVLEYQNGSLDEHFGTSDPPGTIEDVIQVFVAYRNQSDEWSAGFEWTRMQLSASDYCVVVAATSADQVENPFEMAQRVELPDFGLDDLVTLYGLLTKELPAKVADEFWTYAEIQPDGLDPIQLVPMPVGFLSALAEIGDSQIDSVTQRWGAGDHFPAGQYDEKAAAKLITELSAIATTALENDETLVICVLDLVVE